MLARKVVTPSGRRIRGYFPSRKVGRMVAWESLLERDAIRLFEFSPSIASYREQPKLITYYIEGEPFSYYPDFELILLNGESIDIEVKPASKLKKKQLREKISSIKNHYERKKQLFRVLTEQVIRVEPKLSNLKLLAYHNRQTGLDDSLKYWQQQLIAGKPEVVADAARILNGDYKKVYRLIAAGYLFCNLDLSIDANSSIKFNREDIKNDQILI